MKRFFLFAFAAAASMSALTGCDTEPQNGPMGKRPITFSSSIVKQAVTRVDGEVWGDDPIGIYMLPTTAASLKDAHAESGNRKHIISASTGKFAPEAGHELYWPVDESAVHFVAYHPYTTEVTGGKVTIDLGDQSTFVKMSAVDFMTASTRSGSGHTETGAAPSLDFYHRLVKIVLSVKGPQEDIDGITATATGFNTTGSYDLWSDQLTPAAGSGKINMMTRSVIDGTATIEMIVMPGVVQQGGISFMFKDNTVSTYDIEANKPFGDGKVYTFDLGVQPTRTVVETGIATSKPWADGDTTTGTINKDKPTGGEPTKPVNPIKPTDPDYTGLVLNEIDGNGKFVELHNTGSKTILLTGVKLMKNDTQTWWTGDASNEIAPGAYVVIVEKNTADATLSGASGISPKQSLKFELLTPDNTSLGMFLRGDASSLGATISSVAPDSFQYIGGEWLLATPTKGAANAASGQPIPQI